MTGKQQVVFYSGVVPQSGKQIIEFGEHTLCHRSIVDDKSDLLVHVGTRVVLMSYPAKTDRSIVLNNLADNIHKLEHYLRNPESYEIVDKGVLSPKNEKVDADADVVYSVEKEPSYSRSGKYAHLNKDVIVKKKYNQKDFRW